MKTHCSNLLAICCVVWSLCGCTDDPGIQEAQTQLSTNELRESNKLYCRFVPINQFPETIESFTIDDKDTIRALADSLSVTSLRPAEVQQIACWYHVEIAWDDNKGFWLLGDDTIVFYDDFSLNRSFPPGYSMAEIGPDFGRILNERCELISRRDSWFDRMEKPVEERPGAE